MEWAGGASGERGGIELYGGSDSLRHGRNKLLRPAHGTSRTQLSHKKRSSRNLRQRRNLRPTETSEQSSSRV